MSRRWRGWAQGLLLVMMLGLGSLARPALAQGAGQGAVQGAVQGAAPAWQTSEVEQTWLAAHPALRVGLTRQFPPFYLREDDSDRVHGYVVELLALWAQRLGVSMQFRHYDSLFELRAALARGEIDLIPFTALELAEAGGALATRPAFSSNLVLAARRDVPDTSPTGDFAGRRVAVEAGSSLETMLASRYPSARLLPYAGADEALRAVASGSADLFIGYQQVVVYHVERLLLANIELRRSLGPVALGPLVRPDALPLRSLLDKAIAGTTQTDRARLAERWLPAASVRVPLPAASALLSDPEQRWVAEHGRIRVGYDPSFGPVTLRGKLGNFEGYGAELMRLLGAKSGLTVEQEIGAPFGELYERGRQDQLDVIVGMARTALRRQDYDFVGPFLSTPTVLFTRPGEVTQVSDTGDIGPRRLALLRSHFLIPELRARHPGIALVELDRQDQVLSAVAEGAAEVGLGNLYVVNELLERRYAGKVALSGLVRNGDSELYFGVSRHHPELTRVLSRALEAVNDSESATLRARWLAREVPGGTDWPQVLRVFGPLVLVPVLIAVLLWIGQRRLRRAHEAERAARVLAEDSMAARSRFLAYLSHELRGTLGAVSSGAELLRQSDDPALRERLLVAIGASAGGLLQLLEQTLRYEQTLQGGLTLHPERVDLARWWSDALVPARLAAEAKGLVFVQTWQGGAGPVQVDPLRLGQVLANLLNNAIKFTARGQVRVQGEWQGESQGEPQGGRLRLCVEDSGPGLSPQDRERLFQPYAQGGAGRRAAQGAGLGLAISAQIVQAMGGTLTVSAAQDGGGARFEVTVPLPAV